MRVDGEPPATLVCENYVPKQLVLGLYPSGGQRSKNGFYATVDLDTPILPEAAHLLPVVRGGLTRLCQGLAVVVVSAQVAAVQSRCKPTATQGR